MSRQGVIFTQAHIDRLEREIGPLINANAATTTKYVQNLTSSLSTGTGGYGSLIKVPLDPDGTTFHATLEDAIVTFDAAWLNYSSSIDFKTLISTLIKREGRQTPVMVSVTDFYDETGKENNSADAIVDRMISWHQNWRNRENNDNSPSYRGEVMMAHPMDGGEPVPVLVCGTFMDGPYYVGNKIELMKKAMIIASELGPDLQLGPDGRVNLESNMVYHHKSIRNYLLDITDACVQNNWAVEKERLDLVKMVNYFRNQTPDGYRKHLEQRESGVLDYRANNEKDLSPQKSKEAFEGRLERMLQASKASNSSDLTEVFKALNKSESGIDPELYDLCAKGPDLSEQEWYALEWQARKEMQECLAANSLPDHLVGKPIKDLPSDYPMAMEWPVLDCSKGRQRFNMEDDYDPDNNSYKPVPANAPPPPTPSSAPEIHPGG